MDTSQTIEKLKGASELLLRVREEGYEIMPSDSVDIDEAIQSALTLIEAGEKDKARLDWLEASAPNAEYYGAWQVQLGGYESNSGLVRAVLCDDHRHKTVRDALDAAMGGEAPYEGL